MMTAFEIPFRSKEDIQRKITEIRDEFDLHSIPIDVDELADAKLGFQITPAEGIDI